MLLYRLNLSGIPAPHIVSGRYAQTFVSNVPHIVSDIRLSIILQDARGVIVTSESRLSNIESENRKDVNFNEQRIIPIVLELNISTVSLENRVDIIYKE